MKLVRTVFIAMAVLLPVSWTTAKAADPAPAAVEGEKKDKKSVKTEKSEKTEKTEKTTEKAADKK